MDIKKKYKGIETVSMHDIAIVLTKASKKGWDLVGNVLSSDYSGLRFHALVSKSVEVNEDEADELA